MVLFDESVCSMCLSSATVSEHTVSNTLSDDDVWWDGCDPFVIRLHTTSILLLFALLLIVLVVGVVVVVAFLFGCCWSNSFRCSLFSMLVLSCIIFSLSFYYFFVHYLFCGSHFF